MSSAAVMIGALKDFIKPNALISCYTVYQLEEPFQKQMHVYYTYNKPYIRKRIENYHVYLSGYVGKYGTVNFID